MENIKRATLVILSFFFALTIHAQTEWEWDFMPKLYRGQAVLETETTLWVNAYNAILEIDLQTEEVKIHHYGTMKKELGKSIFDRPSSFIGLWIDNNDRVGAFVADGRGFVRQDGDGWEYIPFSFGPFYYPRNIVGKENNGRLLVDRGGNEIYRWNPNHPSIRFQLVEDVLIESSQYLLDNDDRLWAFSNYDDTLFLQRTLRLDTFIIPGDHQAPVRNLVTQDGEIWACRPEGIFYKGWQTYWLSLPLELTTEDVLQATFLSSSPNKAYFFTDQQIYKLQIVDNAAIEIEALNWLGAECCKSALGISRSGMLYYINNKVPRLSRLSDDRELKSIVTSPFIKGAFRSLSYDPQGRIWGAGVRTMFFSGGRWEPVEQLFPDYPFPWVWDLKFRKPFIPVVLVGGPDGYNFQQYINNHWQRLPSDILVPPLNSRIKIHVDAFNRIWHLSPSSFSRWEHERWWHDFLSDYFPRSSTRVNNLEVDHQGRIFITGDAQLIVRDGGYYESYSLEELELTSESNGNNNLSSDVDSEGSLFLSNRFEMIKWTNGSILHLPSFDIHGSEESPDNGIQKVFAYADNDIWVTFNNDLTTRLAHFDGESWSTFPDYEENDLYGDYFALVRDKKGSIWVNASEGIYIIHSSKRMLPEPYDILAVKQQLTVSPNPGCCAFQVFWNQEEADFATIELFNMNGVRMKLIDNAYFLPGQQSRFFTKDDLHPGTYIVRLVSGQKVISGKVVIY